MAQSIQMDGCLLVCHLLIPFATPLVATAVASVHVWPGLLNDSKSDALLLPGQCIVNSHSVAFAVHSQSVCLASSIREFVSLSEALSVSHPDTPMSQH